jgi:hypothetical protein
VDFLGLPYAFIPLPQISVGKNRGAAMYNNYLSCEVCGTELTRANQKQQLDKAGFMHSFCAKCYSEKFPK